MAEDIGERVQRHRANLRAAGLRPVQIWVPNTGARASPRNAAANPGCCKATGIKPAWLEAVADTEGWE